MDGTMEVKRKDGTGSPFPRKVHSVKQQGGVTLFLMFIEGVWKWEQAADWVPAEHFVAAQYCQPLRRAI